MKAVDIFKRYGDMQVLSGFNAEFPACGLVGVAGASGSGKTTLLKILAGLETPDEGHVEGVPDRVSMQFEDDRLFPWLNAHANVTLVGCEASRASALLRELGLAEKENARIDDLSGGQLRRVALARALAFPAPLYLFDEPTARLDAESAQVVLAAIESHCADALAIIASHDDRVLERCATVIDIPSGKLR